MIIKDGKNHWQLTDSGDGTPQTVTEAQRKADNWPPPDGTSLLKSPDYQGPSRKE